jgi:hypothetical protein
MIKDLVEERMHPNMAHKVAGNLVASKDACDSTCCPAPKPVAIKSH